MASKPKLSTTNLVVLSVVVMAVMALIALAVGRGLVKSFVHNSKVIGKKQTADKQLSQNLDNLPRLASSYSSVNNLKPMTDAALPTTSDFPGIVATMEAIAGDSGVTLTSVSPTNATNNTDLSGGGGTGAITTNNPTSSPQGFVFTSSVSGNYQAVLKFLTDTQLSARPFIVTAMQLSGTDAAISGSVTIRTYYYSPDVLANKTEEVQ